MNDAGPFTSKHSMYDASPAVALSAMREHQGPLLLDLDETLYLRNSTEDFIDCARPGLLALLLLRLLDLIKPWRFSGGEITRDWWRVRTIGLLLPWTWWRWRRRVGGLAERFLNRPVLQALQAHGEETWVLTAGFEPIVRPLIEAFGLQDRLRIQACAWNSPRDRRIGKLERALQLVGVDGVRHSLVLTDSSDDEPLLATCARPLRVVWPQARYRRALSDVYLPLQYLTLVKRPGERYIVRGILQEDFAFWVLSTLALASHPLAHVAGLGVLLLSFWAVYEVGYVDNDLVGARFEHDPKLSAGFYAETVATPPLAPWLWASASGVAAVWLLGWPQRLSMIPLASWAAVLVATWGWFLLYNRLDKSTRIWLYPGLQLARSAGFLVLVPVSLPGAAALAAHVLARWMPYVVYRSGPHHWPEVPFHFMRLLFFLLLLTMLHAALGGAPFLNPTMAALLAWNLYRARGELIGVARAARRIDRSRA